MRSFLRFARSGCLLSAVLLLVLLGRQSCGAEAKPAPTPPAGEDPAPVLALSPFEVTAERMEFKSWISVSSPHFVLYTDAKANDAALLVRQMEMMHQATQFFLRRKGVELPPLLVVLPTARSDWRKIASKGTVQWEVATSLVGTTRKLLLVQYDWQADGLASLWSMVAMRELIDMNLRGPLWFERGVSSFFHTAEFNGDTLTIGRQGIDAYWIKRYGWMNWPRFFSIDRRSPEFTQDSTQHTQFEGQCAVLGHFALANPDPAWTLRLLAWSAYMDAGNAPTETKFKEVFQRDWKELEKQLDQMLHGGKYTTGIIRFPEAALSFKIVTDKPSGRELRELFVLSQVLNRTTKESELSLDTLLQRGLRTASLRELLADACDSRQRPEAALRELRGLIEGGSSNPMVFAEAASLLFDRSVTKRSLDTRLGEEATEIRTLCRRALELEPRLARASEALAWTEALGPIVEKENVDAIIRICRTLEGNARTDGALTALAVARWRSGGIKQARAIAERIVASDFSGKSVKELSRELLTRLDAAPHGAEPTAAGTASAPQVKP